MAEVVVVNLPARMLHMDFTIISDAAMELAEDTCEQHEALNCDPMDRYPELNFACSQAQQFKWLKEIYPYGWERVKAKVKSGQFHPIGGSWVEHDTNLPCGKLLDNTALMAFGKGDGGGGPTWQHLERMRQLRGMADTMGAPSLVTWYGELYFELHRGVYTTQARTKLHNRSSEILLHDIELLATIASIQDKGLNIPEGGARRDTSSDDAKAVTVEEITPGLFQLQNAHLTVTVENGTITSIYDRRARRETLAGKANQYAVFDDKPIYWQAWAAEVYHLDTRKELSNSNTTIHEDKGHRASVVTETRISENSSIRTIISLTSVLDEQPSLIECTADVDWDETMKFLKVEFPVKVSNTEASYETQYGVIKRPTHYNTS
ncbi:Alpha-mannosidase like protein [Verticillium longisporum]|uniref:Alpha-mannosidase like protein n=1 Tax=Verticillium longisporum TaxID=100787 RepID=A0A8I3AGN1_VERLO|nr:Alpha-mannosidase like protein [Verticillium longisporum]